MQHVPHVPPAAGVKTALIGCFTKYQSCRDVVYTEDWEFKKDPKIWTDKMITAWSSYVFTQSFVTEKIVTEKWMERAYLEMMVAGGTTGLALSPSDITRGSENTHRGTKHTHRAREQRRE